MRKINYRQIKINSTGFLSLRENRFS